MSGQERLLRALTLAVCGLLAFSNVAADEPADAAATTLPAYSEAEWNAQLAQWREAAAQEIRRHAEAQAAAAAAASASGQSMEKVPMPANAASVALLAPGTAKPAPSLDSVSVQGAVVEDESITNVQTAGVDEGGIVKQHGRHLVVLRRGRLFSIDIGGNGLRPVSTRDAFGPDTDPEGGWYDEMLISGDTIVVIGYDYSERATSIGLFTIDAAGDIRYRDTHYLRSDDYYSSSNSASRLVGQTLLFYTPIGLSQQRIQASDVFPTLGSREGGAASVQYLPTLSASRIHRSHSRPPSLDDFPTLHAVTRCHLAETPMRCESDAVLGPSSRQFYVSQDSVYVWTTYWADDEAAASPSSVIRMPLDGSAPQQLQTTGGPIDQLSFLQDADGYLNVLLVADSHGDGMWSSEVNGGDAALLRVPLSEFGGIERIAALANYHPLPYTEEWGASNRFIGDWLLYSGTERGKHAKPGQPLHALRYAQPDQVQTLRLPHALERIEALGQDGIVVGEDARGDLHFTSVSLRAQAGLASSFVQADAAQGESRTHGFFYKAQDAGTGILGLPIKRDTSVGMQRYLDESAGVIYLRNRELRLSPMG